MTSTDAYEGIAPSALLDRVRPFNRDRLNPTIQCIAGRVPGPIGLLSHRGRRTGRRYRTPVLAHLRANRVLIPLTYGSRADWLQNVLAAGRAGLLLNGRVLSLSNPRVRPVDEVIDRFPLLLRIGMQLVGMRWVAELDAESLGP